VNCFDIAGVFAVAFISAEGGCGDCGGDVGGIMSPTVLNPDNCSFSTDSGVEVCAPGDPGRPSWTMAVSIDQITPTSVRIGVSCEQGVPPSEFVQAGWRETFTHPTDLRGTYEVAATGFGAFGLCTGTIGGPATVTIS